MRYILLTGMSGAGKTTSLRHLEDMGCPYVDNLPSQMVMRFMELFEQTAPQVPMVVVAVDIRSGDLFDAHAVRNLIAAARTTGTDIRVLFLEASDDTLLNRFKETRRDHPLHAQTGDLLTAISQERERLQPLREMADLVLDTSALRPRTLREKLSELLFVDTSDRDRKIKVELTSFGFKRGHPRDADLVLDVRFLPNPFYIDDIRFQTGLQSGVREYVLGAPVTQTFLAKSLDMLAFLLPNYQNEGKRRLIIGVGCTGGAHRSVAIAEALGEGLRHIGYRAKVQHRDMELEKENWRQL
ncbi:MAG: RNase adapter RapZ [Oscillospiraceae bacterium]|nr:RNase adapter RapZ [Oscillospiraceae bacterium]